MSWRKCKVDFQKKNCRKKKIFFLQFFLPKHLCGGNEAKHILLYAVAPVGVEKAISVLVGAKIEIERPRSPKQIHVAVSHASVSKVDKAAEFPIL